MWEYSIRVLRVVDGDTVDAQVDLGFSTHKNVRIRVHGIDTPEVRTRDKAEKAKGIAATNRVKDLIANADEVVLRSHGVDKFGRCLGTIILIGAGQEFNLAEQLILEGHGTPYFGGKR